MKERTMVVATTNALGGEAVDVIAVLANGGVDRVEIRATAADGSGVALRFDRSKGHVLYHALSRALNAQAARDAATGGGRT